MIRGAIRQCFLSVRLYFRNPLALSYGYLFPTVFLAAYWSLYRFDRVPLVQHIGELLTVTILGGACFGLPTTLVSEREKGVWRRYRLIPVPVALLVVSTIVARYVLVVSAGVLQLALAMIIGMPRPVHPLELSVAFTVVAFAFLGCGLVIAMLADNVPAVQALGQTIFLPMLIIGGIAVPLASLPSWAQHASMFFPGRYAVNILQTSAAGDGLSSALFDAAALVVIGIAACTAGAKMFRWDEHERFSARGGYAWIAVALAAWAAVGVAAESRGYGLARVAPRAIETVRATPTELAAAPALAPAAPTPAPTRTSPVPAPASRGAALRSRTRPSSWEAVTEQDITADLTFDQLPPDGGIVTPIAASGEQPDPGTAEWLESFTRALPDWAPGSAADPVQRVRNLLYIAAVADLLQRDIERYVPAVIFERLQNQLQRPDLLKILYWIALHPFDGDDDAVTKMSTLGLPPPAAKAEDVRGRAAVYGVKLLGRLLGKIDAG